MGEAQDDPNRAFALQSWCRFNDGKGDEVLIAKCGKGGPHTWPMRHCDEFADLTGLVFRSLTGELLARLMVPG